MFNFKFKFTFINDISTKAIEQVNNLFLFGFAYTYLLFNFFSYDHFLYFGGFW